MKTVMKNILERIFFACYGFLYPKEIIEMRDLVCEMYEWTNYKHTEWALRAKKFWH